LRIRESSLGVKNSTACLLPLRVRSSTNSNRTNEFLKAKTPGFSPGYASCQTSQCLRYGQLGQGLRELENSRGEASTTAIADEADRAGEGA
jgi:hypothetical protein